MPSNLEQVTLQISRSSKNPERVFENAEMERDEKVGLLLHHMVMRGNWEGVAQAAIVEFCRCKDIVTCDRYVRGHVRRRIPSVI